MGAYYHYPPFKRWSQIKEETMGAPLARTSRAQSARIAHHWHAHLAHNLRASRTIGTHILRTICAHRSPLARTSRAQSARILSPIDKTSVEHEIAKLSLSTFQKVEPN